MVTTTTKIIGILMLIITTTLIVVTNMEHGLKIDVSKNDTKFYIYNISGDNNWTLSGTETWVIFMNNKTYKPNSATLKNTVLKNNITEILRTVKYTTSNVTIIDKYTFDGNDKTIESFPIKHTINITCKSCTYKYTYKLFNNRMNIDYEQPDDMNLTTLSYIVNGNRIINIRMYDPLWNVSGTYTKNTPSLDPNVSYVTSNLNCSVYADMKNFTNITYNNGTNYTIYYWYFKNGVQQTRYSTLSYHNTTPVFAYAPLATTETLTLGDIWHCRVRMTTTTGTVLYTTPILISNYVTIQNSGPTVTPISPLGISMSESYGYNATGGTKVNVNGLTLHNITYTGANQTFNITSAIDIPVTIMMWGAGGGGGAVGGWSYGFVGGAGGYTGLNITLKAGQNYTVMVGQGGVKGTYGSIFSTNFGGGGTYCPGNTDCRYSGGGGGRSQFSNSSTILAIAGGGGGGGSSRVTNGQRGGAGGGLIAQDGESYTTTCRGRGANQTAVGAGGTGTTAGSAGSGSTGGAGAVNSYGGAGGGGYYGGGGGAYFEANDMGGGGGGSGYVITGGITTTGSYNVTANSNNIYRGTAGNGGAIDTAGSNGLVIITYNDTRVYMSPSTIYVDASTPPTLYWSGADVNGDTLRYEVYGEIQ